MFELIGLIIMADDTVLWYDNDTKTLYQVILHLQDVNYAGFLSVTVLKHHDPKWLIEESLFYFMVPDRKPIIAEET